MLYDQGEIMNYFENKVFWITGANKGIGKAIAIRLINEFYKSKFILSSSSKETIKNLINEIGMNKNVYFFPFDLRDKESIDQTYDKIHNSIGEVDCLINNAGVGRFAPMLELNEDDLDFTFDINFKAPFFLIKKVLPNMVKKKSGAIINILSVVVRKSFPNSSIYSASKSALLALTNSLRQEVRKDGIKIINVMPGATETDIWHPRQREKYSSLMMQPDDVADVIVSQIKLLSNERLHIEEIVIRPQNGDLS